MREGPPSGLAGHRRGGRLRHGCSEDSRALRLARLAVAGGDDLLPRARDDHLLRAAAEDDLTLVTYDRASIPPVLTEWGITGEEHAGVIFIDERTIPQSDLGGQVLALIAHWDQTHEWAWRNVIAFLRSAR